MKKWSSWAAYFIPLLLLLFVLLGICFGQKEEQNSPFYIVVSNGSAEEKIQPWWQDDTCYFFLPSYANWETTKLCSAKSVDLIINGEKLCMETSLKDFVSEKNYSFCIEQKREKQKGKLVFLQSANVATLYLDTLSGNMESLEADKTYEESVATTLYTDTGIINYQGRKDSLRGRGNSTWLKEKKPWQLTLSEEQGLLDMGVAKKWILLANAYDASNLRNKIVCDFAKQTELEWTPDCEFVELYCNGVYYGLYLLIEKVEFGENRLQQTEDRQYLCSLDKRAEKNKCFVTELGKIIEVENVAQETEEWAYLTQQIQAMEQAILSDTEEKMEKYIDIDSWARTYLIDEIFKNSDAGAYSTYFYSEKNGDGLKFYRGPIWDFDLSIGLKWEGITTPYCLLVKEQGYYGALYKNEKYYQKMKELYTKEYKPILKEFIDNEITEFPKQILCASRNNAIRWNMEIESVDTLQRWLSERVEFLDGLWLDDTTYCTVTIPSFDYTGYLNYAVISGEIFTQLPTAEELGMEEPIWYDEATGEIFNPSQPITKDMTLLLQQSTLQENLEENLEEDGVSLLDKMVKFTILHIEILFCFGCLGLASIIGSVLLWKEWRYRKAGGKQR